MYLILYTSSIFLLLGRGLFIHYLFLLIISFEGFELDILLTTPLCVILLHTRAQLCSYNAASSQLLLSLTDSTNYVAYPNKELVRTAKRTQCASIT
jgi:hypothetical protein